ncbi:MAG: hypothetical protein NTY19_42980 [Planctomycetota bacterium]|nr:hypothetical protein [Planctomycetota bacterium]
MKKSKETVLDAQMDANTSSEMRYFEARDRERRAVKRLIAAAVVEHYLSEGDSILLDAGSSLYPIAEIIAKSANTNPSRRNFTIMTHNYRAFEVLVKTAARDQHMNIILAGGRYDQDLNALFGNQTVLSYEDFFPRVVLLGVSGLVSEIGLFCHGNTEELAVKKAIFDKRARDRIIVADHSKIGLLAGFRFGDSQALRANVDRCIVVTDTPAEEQAFDKRERFSKQIQHLKSQGIEVLEVQADTNGPNATPSVPQ